MVPWQSQQDTCGDVPKDVPNEALYRFSYWKGEHGQETHCSLEFPHACDFCVSSYIKLINAENLQTGV